MFTQEQWNEYSNYIDSIKKESFDKLCEYTQKNNEEYKKKDEEYNKLPWYKKILNRKVDLFDYSNIDSNRIEIEKYLSVYDIEKSIVGCLEYFRNKKSCN